MPKVTKQKNGRYQRSIVVGKDESGKPIRKFFTGRTIKEVDVHVEEFKRGQSVTASEPAKPESDITFSQMGAI